MMTNWAAVRDALGMTPIAKALPASRAEWDRRIAQYREACFLDDAIWKGEG